VTSSDGAGADHHPWALASRILPEEARFAELCSAWGERALLLEHAVDAALPRLGTARLRTLIQRGALDVKRVRRDERGVHQESPLVGDDVDAALAAGFTLCADNVQRADDATARLAAGLKARLASPARVLVNAYWSPAGTGFGTHYDAQDVLVLQIEGEKVWEHGATPAVVAPLDNRVLGVPSDEDASSAEGIDCISHLRPGDLLHLPAGTWHRASAGASPSFALTFTFVPLRIGELVVAALAELLRDDEGLRRGVPLLGGHQLHGFDPAVERRLALALDHVRDAATRLGVSTLWRRSLEATSRLPDHAPSARGASAEPAEHSRPRAGLRARFATRPT
jgi:ribosomal protein L16 Arg81 hydroxylase